MSRQGLVFGAGAVGRGFIGEILSDAGWRVVFVDASPELVAALQQGEYPHDTVSSAGTVHKMVKGCTAIAAQDRDAVRAAVASSDVVFTSVGARNLPHIADSLAAGLADRHRAGSRAIDVFLAENLHDGAGVMRALLESELDGFGVDPRAVLDRVGLVETSIGRMIPVPTAEQRREHPALVAVEPYRQLPFDRAACRAAVPDIPDLLGNADVDFGFYTDRKLYVHNQGHSLTAYLGELKGHREIATAIADPDVRASAAAAMHAAARALAAKYSQPESELLAHADDLLQRFGNTALHDTVERVGRDPERKLQMGERFLGALELTSDWGEPEPILPGIALATRQLVLSRPATAPDETIEAVRSEVARVTPGLVGRFDELLAGVLDDRA